MCEVVKFLPNSIHLAVRVCPGAKRSAVEGVWNKTHLRIALQAPAVDGKANDALVVFLAKFLNVKKKNIEIIAGQTNRCKVISVQTEDVDERERIGTWLKQELSMENK